jgi:hypothetical protein
MTRCGGLLAGLVALALVLPGFAVWRYHEHKIGLVLAGKYDDAAICDGDSWVRRAEARAVEHGFVAVADGRARLLASVSVPSIRLQACLNVVGADFVDREALRFEQALADVRQLGARRVTAIVNAYLDDRFDAGKAVVRGWVDTYNLGRSLLAGCAEGLQQHGWWGCPRGGIDAAQGDWGAVGREAEGARLGQLAASLRGVAEDVEDRSARLLNRRSVEASREHQRALVARILRRNIAHVRFARIGGETSAVAVGGPSLEVASSLPGSSTAASAVLSAGVGLGLEVTAGRLFRSSLVGFLASSLLTDAVVVKIEEARYRDEIKEILERRLGEELAAWEDRSAKAYRYHLTETRDLIKARIVQAIAGGTLIAFEAGSDR